MILSICTFLKEYDCNLVSNYPESWEQQKRCKERNCFLRNNQLFTNNSGKYALPIEETFQKIVDFMIVYTEPILNSQITIYDTETYPNLDKVRLLLDSLHQVVVSLLIESGNIFNITLVSASKTTFSMQHLTLFEFG